MAVGPPSEPPSRADRSALLGVCAVALAALVVRFVDLGGRVAHWDEGRVGFWILDYVETGDLVYRPIIHGPFYHHVTPLVFELFGTTDAAMRVVPALVTGLLPLSALLLRDRLRTGELLALAFFLAFNPVLLYYGRFMRGDPLVGAFMFVAFALFVRALDTRLYRHLFAGVAFVALGFTVKENAPVYLMCWLGGLAVYGYLLLFAARTRGEFPVGDWLARRYERLANDRRSSPEADGGRLGRSRSPVARVLFGLGVVALALVEFLAIVVAFYAPRGDSGVTVENAFADPSMVPALVGEATVGSFRKFYDLWGDGGQSEHAYVPYLADLLGTLGAGALVVCLLAVVGFLLDTARREGARPVVVVAFLWGLASVFGYPIITDIKAPWAAVHVVLPWAVPAAVALGTIGRWGREAFEDDDRVGLAGVAVVVLLLTGLPLYTAYDTSFVRPQAESNELVQYAQPSGDVHAEMTALERLAERNEGTDVVLYGGSLVKGDPIYQRPSCAGDDGWFNALPLPWYLERADAETACAPNASALDEVDRDGRPPVVISTADHRSTLEERYPEYTVTVHKMRLWGSEWVFLVDTDRFPEGENPMAGVEEAPSGPSEARALSGANVTGTTGGGDASALNGGDAAAALAPFHYR